MKKKLGIRYSARKKSNMLKDATSGMGMTELASKHGVSKATAYKVVIKARAQRANLPLEKKMLPVKRKAIKTEKLDLDKVSLKEKDWSAVAEENRRLRVENQKLKSVFFKMFMKYELASYEGA